MKKNHVGNDWTGAYCGEVAWEGENKLRHLAKHEPAIRKLIRRDFINTMTLGMQAFDRRAK